MAEILITNLMGIEPQRARLVALNRKEWNEWRVGLLHTMWQDGMTFTEMAKVLGVSKGVIAGKVQRMKAQWEAQA